MTDNTLPLITIGICCYNSEDTVERAISSAIAQDWPNYEIIIIDDGSADQTPNVIRQAISGVKQARFIQHEVNKTFPGALNTVLENARGEFIAIFDDDDESAPNRLSIQYDTILKYEERTNAKLVACWGSGERIYPNGYIVKFDAIGSQDTPPKGTEIIDYILFYGKKLGVFYGAGTPSCSLMTRKSTYDAVGFYDETMFRSEDSDFSIRLGKNNGHFIGCKEKVITQYSTDGAEKRAEVVYNSYKMLMEKHQGYLKSCNRYHYAMLWNKLRLQHFSGKKFKFILVLSHLFCRHPIMTWHHFWDTAPKRFVHEWKMSRRLKEKEPKS